MNFPIEKMVDAECYKIARQAKVLSFIKIFSLENDLDIRNKEWAKKGVLIKLSARKEGEVSKGNISVPNTVIFFNSQEVEINYDWLVNIIRELSYTLYKVIL